MRATALLTSMNSGVENLFKEIEEPSSTVPEIEEESLQEDWSMDDLSAGDLMIHPAEEEEKEEEEPDPLGDFFSSMNK